MRVIYSYNPFAAREVELVSRVVAELREYVEQVEAIDFREIRDVYRISTTPALVFVRDDLQGGHLLEEDMERGKLRVALECWRAVEEEEANIHQKETRRIDAVVTAEVARRMGEARQIMSDMADLLTGKEDAEARARVYSWLVREKVKALEDIPEPFRSKVKT